MTNNKAYIAIDLKSFYASVECVERGLDPITTNLVVADPERTEKTICLAVTPSLKAFGIHGRPRLFEVIQKVKEVNAERLSKTSAFSGSSYDSRELNKNPSLSVDYITAPPRMAFYMKYSKEIYKIYLKYISPEDIHVYSIDEVFIDASAYLNTYKTTAHDLAVTMIRDVLKNTGITATAGIGTNLYLAKIAMDIMAKRIPPNKDGVRIAELDEVSYRELLWTHRPITDFWRVGRGYAKRLADVGLYTMGDIAKCSVGNPNSYYNEDLLYKLFGINAELLIDHAWGWEPCTIAHIKDYKPENNSLCSGQVLQQPYESIKARLVVREMADLLTLDLVDKELLTNQLVLTVGYDIDNMDITKTGKIYKEEVTTDHYGRVVPKAAHGSISLACYTSSTKKITEAVAELFDKIVNPDLLVRRISISANHLINEAELLKKAEPVQMDLFTDRKAIESRQIILEQERKIQKTLIELKKKYGKNAVLRGMNFTEGATAKDRNKQIGGHKA